MQLNSVFDLVFQHNGLFSGYIMYIVRGDSHTFTSSTRSFKELLILVELPNLSLNRELVNILSLNQLVLYLQPATAEDSKWAI